MKRFLILSLCLLITLSIVLTGCGSAKKVVIGSKDFTESIVLGEIIAQLIEKNSDIKVERKFNMGGTFINFEAIKKGEIDIYPEYTGTALTAQLKKDVINDPQEVYNIVKEEFKNQFKFTWLEPFGFHNTYAIGVTEELANQYGLEKCSDLKAIGDKLIFGAEHEFFNRQDGFDGFVDTYGISFKDVVKMNTSLKYQAIGEGKMNVTDPFATDGQIIQYNLKVLKDDLGFFPPYYAAPIVKEETLKKYPELESILNKLAGKISDEEMTKLNYQADTEKKEIKSIVTEFLTSKGF